MKAAAMKVLKKRIVAAAVLTVAVAVIVVTPATVFEVVMTAAVVRSRGPATGAETAAAVADVRGGGGKMRWGFKGWRRTGGVAAVKETVAVAPCTQRPWW